MTKLVSLVNYCHMSMKCAVPVHVMRQLHTVHLHLPQQKKTCVLSSVVFL